MEAPRQYPAMFAFRESGSESPPASVGVPLSVRDACGLHLCLYRPAHTPPRTLDQKAL